MPINEQGYLRPTYDEILESRIALAQELFGEDIDTSNASPLGKFIRLSVQDLADAYEDQEIMYYGRFPNTATGVSLDRLMPFAGITRNAATRAEHRISFVGTPGYEIPVGFLVSTTGEEEFYLLNSVTLNAEGNGTGIVQCTELGLIGNVKEGSITEIVNPDANVSSIQHIGVNVLGNDTESDTELRKRFAMAVEGAGSGTASAIKGAVMRVSGVIACEVVENTDVHSIAVYVYPHSMANEEVAKAIFSKKAAGITTEGNVAYTVNDISGRSHSISMFMMNDIPVHINLSIKTDNQFELDGVNQIKNALSEYVNGLSNGEEVVFTTLYKHIYSIPGIKDVSNLSVSTNGSTYVSSNIAVDVGEIARLDINNISIEVTSNASA